MTLEDSFIKDHLSYDPDTGIITWKKRAAMCVKVGSEAGHYDSYYGYRRIRICHHGVMAHRVAWFLFRGIWPENMIDHINGIKTDNRIVNLREATARENQQNRRVHRAGKSIGVDFIKGKWKARIVINGKIYSLGFFISEKEAAQVYQDACATLESNPFWIPPKIENIALGCSYKPRLKKWQAAIQLHGKSTYLGIYNTQEEAHAAYLEAYNKKMEEQSDKVFRVQLQKEGKWEVSRVEEV
jgi:hypothetical protein